MGQRLDTDELPGSFMRFEMAPTVKTLVEPKAAGRWRCAETHQPWDFFLELKRCQLSRATDLASSRWFITASLYDAKQSHLGDDAPLGSATCSASHPTPVLSA
jgi:hypothetical protein